MKRFTSFIREKGFYLALLACILAAAASSVWAIRTVVGRLNGTAESQSSSEEEFVWDAPELPVERSAENVPIEPDELRGSSPSSLSEATSSSPSGGQEGSGQQAASPEVSSAWPVPGQMLAAFSGDELVYNETLGDWRTHNGVDLAAEAGEPVKAAALGQVSAVYQDAVWGWTVEVSDGSRVYRYQGLETPAVQTDEEVHAGDVLGTVGRVPAEAKLPSHLHFEIRQDGSCIDPETVLG